MKEKIFYHEERPWGSYTLFVDNKKCSVKILEVKEQLSLQSHKYREERWFIISGEVMVSKGPTGESLEEGKKNLEEYYLKKGDNIFIPKGYLHRMKNLGKEAALVLEILEGEYKEDDIIRYEDIYGRVEGRS